MDRIEIEDPVLYDTFDTDGKGRINLGEQYGDSEVKICVVEVSED